MSFYRIRINEFGDELKNLKLYERVYWYNILSMDELKSIAASLFLPNLAYDLEHVLEPAKESMKLASGKSPDRNELLQQRMQATRKALQNLNATVPKITGNTYGGSSGGARCSGGR